MNLKSCDPGCRSHKKKEVTHGITLQAMTSLHGNMCGKKLLFSATLSLLLSLFLHLSLQPSAGTAAADELQGQRDRLLFKARLFVFLLELGVMPLIAIESLDSAERSASFMLHHLLAMFRISPFCSASLTSERMYPRRHLSSGVRPKLRTENMRERERSLWRLGRR